MSDNCPTASCLRKHGHSNPEECAVRDAAKRGLGMRHLQVALMAMASFMAYSLRSNLSVAIVAMVYHENDNENGTLSAEYPSYEWNEEIQGLVLSSFFWGYFITQIPAGILTERHGGHRFLCAAILLCSLLTMVLPPCTYLGDWRLVCANRMLQGASQGFVYPSIYTLLGVWAPPDERGRFASFALGAQLLGTVAATPLTGFLSSAYGWPSVFYWFGAVGAIVGITMIFFGADTPANHWMISVEEKQYIQYSLGGAKEKLPVPWRQITTSRPVWASVFANALSALVFLTFLMEIPTYLGTVLKFNIEKSGVLSALPFFVSWVFSFVFSWLSDCFISRGCLRITPARKIFNSIANTGAAICMVLMAYSTTPAMSVFLLTAFLGVLAASFPGVQSSFVDLAPNFSGTVFSISNFLSGCLGLTGPIIVGLIVTETGNPEQWRIVFFLSAAVMFFGNLIFVIWGTADTQWWNWPDLHRGKNDMREKDVKFKEVQFKDVL